MSVHEVKIISVQKLHLRIICSESEINFISFSPTKLISVLSKIQNSVYITIKNKSCPIQ